MASRKPVYVSSLLHSPIPLQLNGLLPGPPSQPQVKPPLTFLPSFNQQVLVDTTPLPDSIPKVKELGVSSAPLLSAAYFIGARCRDYNDDFMKCKTDNPGKGEFDCLQEGRRVTRCARSVYVYAIQIGSWMFTPCDQRRRAARGSRGWRNRPSSRLRKRLTVVMTGSRTSINLVWSNSGNTGNASTTITTSYGSADPRSGS